MCSEGKHPPDEWGHLTYVHFYKDDYQNWHVLIQADDLDEKNFSYVAGTWVDAEGVEVANAEGLKWLNNRFDPGN